MIFALISVRQTHFPCNDVTLLTILTRRSRRQSDLELDLGELLGGAADLADDVEKENVRNLQLDLFLNFSGHS